MSLMKKLLKNTTLKYTDVLSTSTVFNNKDVIPTSVPSINLALSGKLDGGISPGLLQITGPSKHFKSAFTLLIASSYLKKYDDAIVLFYDSEFGTPDSYFTSFDLPKDRVLHCPITNIEEFKNDIMTQLEIIERGEHVCIIVDSVGNLASKKEVDDALEGKSVADMTRAKALKSLGRMVTTHLSLKDIPMIVVNHVYKEIGMFPKDIVGGGTGLYLSSDNIWIVGRQQNKEGGEVNGYKFIINIEKSRHVQEKSKIPIVVTNDGGISRYSGLFDIALEGNFIKEPSKGYYTILDSDKKIRRSEIENNSDYWKEMLNNEDFKKYIENTYRLGQIKMIQEE